MYLADQQTIALFYAVFKAFWSTENKLFLKLYQTKIQTKWLGAISKMPQNGLKSGFLGFSFFVLYLEARHGKGLQGLLNRYFK